MVAAPEVTVEQLVATVEAAGYTARVPQHHHEDEPADALRLRTLVSTALAVPVVLLSMVGSDIETGQSRMAFDIPELADGIGFVVVAMGVFGYAEIMRNLEQKESRDLVQSKITGLWPTMKDLKDSSGAIARGTVLGSILGILPGGGAVIVKL